MTEAGYPDGFTAKLIFGTLQHSAPLAQSVQQNAARVGVKLTLERMSNAQLFAKVRGRDYQSAMQAWQTASPTPTATRRGWSTIPTNRRKPS